MWFKKKQQTELKVNKKVRLGLALGGGGARGVGHIGVLKAFSELGIDVDYVCGTSAGAIVGALYSSGLTWYDIEKTAKSLKKGDIKKKNMFFMPTSTEKLEETVLSIFGKDLMFSELKKPFCAVSVNLKDGSEVIIDNGSVAKAVCASSAVPGVFKPVVYRDMHLVDGGLANNVPADVARKMGANVVIAIDVNKNRGQGTESLKVMNVLSSTLGVIMQKNIETKLQFADLVITPDLSDFSSSKLGDVSKMIERGYDAVMENKEAIFNLLNKRPKRKKIIWLINSKRKEKF
ncbi:MAG: patatin-like phospholipase family protein [bacterium]|nr:patatin-like phospholipase family protein [bacterium]